MEFDSCFRLRLASVLLFGFAGAGCIGSSSTGASGGTSTPPNNGVLNVSGCVAGTSAGAWVPNVSVASAANHNSNVSVTNTTYTTTAPLAGLADAISGKEVSVTFTVPSDLGLNGSLTLLGQVSGYPSGITATAYPVLTSLSDGTNEYINLPRNGSGQINCAGGAFYSCNSANCNDNASCQSVSYPSAYADFAHFWQHQIPNNGFESINRFPTCRWTQGSTTSPFPSSDPTSPACAFNTYLSGTSGHLPIGTYIAKYLLLTDGYATIPNGNNATLSLTVTQRRDTVDATVGGAIDVSVILVGSKNISDSHTVSGQRNLNTMFDAFGNYLLGTYGMTNNVNIKIGTINVYELTCQQGGDALATISSSQIGTLLQVGSGAIGSTGQGKAVNIFLLSEFSDNSAILGVDGQITAPQINGLQTSGLTVATFNMLALYNPGCSTTPCPLNQQDADFYELGNTMTHETGHFLGLNHPSEAPGTMHDIVYDTPTCTTTDPGDNDGISINTCLNTDTNVFPPTGLTCNSACAAATAGLGGYDPANGIFCPNVQECGFNHMMWWQSKNDFPATGAADGNQFSPDSGIIMNLSSYVQ